MGFGTLPVLEAEGGGAAGEGEDKHFAFGLELSGSTIRGILIPFKDERRGGSDVEDVVRAPNGG
jgi:hypothetical protein